MLRAVLFDLDDTLFDHRRCAREALAAVHREHACFNAIAFDEFERAHAALLERLHVQVVAGRLDIDSARTERFRRLLEMSGGDDRQAAAAAFAYRQRYVAARQPVTGAPALLRALRPHAGIAVVSNNLLAEQREKMRQCGLDGLVDALVVSEETGIAKPDPAIFRIALARLGVAAHEAIMIGDSWEADVAGARAADLPAIWYNPHRLPAPDRAGSVFELHAFEPADEVVTSIFESHRRATGH